MEQGFRTFASYLEVKLLERSDPHSGDDGHEGQVHHRRKNLLQEDGAVSFRWGGGGRGRGGTDEKKNEIKKRGYEANQFVYPGTLVYSSRALEL